MRDQLTDDEYVQLSDRSKRMKALFLADPEDKLPEAVAGRELILEMEDILTEVEARQERSS